MDEQLYAELSKFVTNKDKSGLMHELQGLDEVTRAEFARRQRMERDMNKPYDNKPRCADGQLGKFCLLEYDNVEREFETLTAFVAMSNYLYDRLDTQYAAPLAAVAKLDEQLLGPHGDIACDNPEDEKNREHARDYKSIKGFLDSVFNHRYSKHIDTIYDVFLKPLTAERNQMMQESRDNQLNPAFIPTANVVKFDTFTDLCAKMESLHGNIVECSFMDENNTNTYNAYCKMVARVDREEFDSYYGQTQAFVVNGESLMPVPSFWQYRNALNFYNTKLEEHRFLASQLSGMKPSSELLMHVHGVFATTEEMEAYRIKKSENIRGKAVVCPVGRTALGDEFRINKDGIIMYNPADPEIEIMMQGKHNIRRVEAEAVKKRMSRVADRTDPKTVSEIRKWRQARDKLTKGKAKTLQKYAHTDTVEVDAKIENAISSLDKKINDALNMLDDDEVVLETLEVKDGKMKRGEELIMKVE